MKKLMLIFAFLPFTLVCQTDTSKQRIVFDKNIFCDFTILPCGEEKYEVFYFEDTLSVVEIEYNIIDTFVVIKKFITHYDSRIDVDFIHFSYEKFPEWKTCCVCFPTNEEVHYVDRVIDQVTQKIFKKQKSITRI